MPRLRNVDNRLHGLEISFDTLPDRGLVNLLGWQGLAGEEVSRAAL